MGDIYNITAINRSNDVRYISCVLTDEYGETIDTRWAYDEGKAVTIETDQLDTNPTIDEEHGNKF